MTLLTTLIDSVFPLKSTALESFSKFTFLFFDFLEIITSMPLDFVNLSLVLHSCVLPTIFELSGHAFYSVNMVLLCEFRKGWLRWEEKLVFYYAARFLIFV